MINKDVAAQRTHNQRLSHSDFTNPVEVVSWLGALQGQDYAGAKWSIGMRLPGSTDAQIEQAIDDHTIVRTWVMRGTLHLVAAEDVRWMVELVAERLIRQAAARHRQLELDEETFSRSNDILANALRDGERLTRKALFAVLEDAGISTKGQRGVHMLQRASLVGLLCQSIADRNDPTFFHVDSLPAAPKLSREEALAELAQRFFQSRGPATLYDFARWASLTIGDARIGLEAIEKQLIAETVGNDIYLFPDIPTPAPIPPAVMPPGFDEYVLGYKDRSAVLQPQYEPLICPGGNGVFYPTLVIDGQVVGTWKRQVKKGTITITLSPFETLSDTDLDAIQPAAQRYGNFYDMTVVVEQ